MANLNWNDLRVILVLARDGSVQGAARRLNVNDTTISSRLSEVEEALGSRIFDRTERGSYPLTDQGRILVDHAARIEQRILDMENEVAPLLSRAGPALHSREVWLPTHPDQRALARVDVVADWLTTLFRDPTPH